MDTRFPFTKVRLIALQPTPGHTITYHDTRTNGLQLRVTSSGTKSFSFVYRFLAVQQRVTIGRFPEVSIDQARRKVAALQARIMDGENPAASKRHAEAEATAELTLREAFEHYYDDHLKAEGKRTAEALREDFARYLGSVPPGQKKLRGKEKKKSKGSVNWENRKLSSISTADMRRMMISLREGTGARTANKMLVLLNAIYRKCIGWKLYTGVNPCADPNLRKFAIGEKSRSRFLLADELPGFFAALETMDQGFKDFVKLALFTGARRENLMSMRYQDIDWATNTWTVPGEQSKNGDPLRIPLIAPALQILQQRNGKRAKDAVFVFPAASKSGYMSPPTKKWQALLKQAGVKDLRIHDLRRSMASWMINSGASLAIVGESLGHRSAEATRVYARLQQDAVRASMSQGVAAMLDKARPIAANEPEAKEASQ